MFPQEEMWYVLQRGVAICLIRDMILARDVTVCMRWSHNISMQRGCAQALFVIAISELYGDRTNLVPFKQ